MINLALIFQTDLTKYIVFPASYAANLNTVGIWNVKALFPLHPSCKVERSYKNMRCHYLQMNKCNPYSFKQQVFVRSYQFLQMNKCYPWSIKQQIFTPTEWFHDKTMLQVRKGTRDNLGILHEKTYFVTHHYNRHIEMVLMRG